MAAISVVRSLRNLLDVSIAGRADGMGMLWDAASGLYKPAYLAAAKAAALVAESAGGGTIPQASFTTIPNGSDSLLYNPGGGFNSASQLYTVPVSGLYSIAANLRLADNTGAVSYGHGVHTANADHQSFFWTQTNVDAGGRRNGAPYARVAFFNAGDQLRHYVYADVSVIYLNTTLSISLLAVGTATGASPTFPGTVQGEGSNQAPS